MASGAIDRDAVLLRYPLEVPFRVRNSPADRVPSHGTDLMGTTYAIDLVPVDAGGRSAPRGWRALVAAEDPATFIGFGVRIIPPCSGEVVLAHDGEPDHEARRSPIALLPYALGQVGRLRRGPGAIAGNHVVIAAGAGGPFVLLAHLRRGSVAVREGDRVRIGERVGECGNSGNSTEPHVHVQVTDSIDWSDVRGLPLAFEGRLGPELPGRHTVVTPGTVT